MKFFYNVPTHNRYTLITDLDCENDFEDSVLESDCYSGLSDLATSGDYTYDEEFEEFLPVSNRFALLSDPATLVEFGFAEFDYPATPLLPCPTTTDDDSYDEVLEDITFSESCDAPHELLASEPDGTIDDGCYWYRKHAFVFTNKSILPLLRLRILAPVSLRIPRLSPLCHVYSMRFFSVPKWQPRSVDFAQSEDDSFPTGCCENY